MYVLCSKLCYKSKSYNSGRTQSASLFRRLNLKAELALGLADGVAKVDLLDWWIKLPSWAAAYKKVILCQPSSAAVERVFSILKSSFDTDQNQALDYL